MSFEDKDAAHSGSATCTFQADAIAASQEFRKQYETRTNVVKAEDMPWERSPDGLIKHLVHEQAEHPRVLRRSLYAVSQAGRTLRQASPHVGRDRLRGRRLRVTTCTGT